MVGPSGLEPQTSTVSTRRHQLLTATYKAVGNYQVLDNTPWLETSRVGSRVEKQHLSRHATSALRF
jgi:hypothetical protein